MSSVAFVTLGCKVNQFETEVMEGLFKEAGYEILPHEAKADIYVINTCSVTNMADRKSRQMIHRARKQNPDAVIVAAGCYVQARTDAGEKDENIDIVIGNILICACYGVRLRQRNFKFPTAFDIDIAPTEFFHSILRGHPGSARTAESRR